MKPALAGFFLSGTGFAIRLRCCFVSMVLKDMDTKMKIGIVAITEPGYSNTQQQTKAIEALSAKNFAGMGLDTAYRVGDRRSGYGQLYCWQIPKDLPEKFHRLFLKAKAFDLRIDYNAESVSFQFKEV